MDPEIRAQIHAIRHHVGAWLRTDHTFIRITGPDASSWLHSQTSNDVNALQSGEGHSNALLDRQGRLQAHFTLHRWEDEFWLIIEKYQAQRLLEQLDAHLFIEQVTIEETGADLDQLVMQGPRTLGLLASILDTPNAIASELLPARPYGCHPVSILNREALAFRISCTGEDGYVFVLERGEGRPLLDALLACGAGFSIAPVAEAAVETVRIEAGIPKFGVDINSQNPIPETTLERIAVSYDKGCYLGQEVVARLRTYGAVKHALMGLVLESSLRATLAPGETLYIDGKKVGHLKSYIYSPTLNATIALAMLDRNHRTPGTDFTFSTELGHTFNARVVVLPFYEASSREDRARSLYDQALAHFERDTDDLDPAAIPLLKEAILLDPIFEDAYEALGVILHRHHRVDEAIHYMQALARMNPNCLMAHTNLSVFYVAKGMIEEAEQEKAQAAVLGIQKASDERKAKDLADAERKRLESEARERIGMFQEVLEIDPDDSVATFGLGKAYIQLNQYEEAIPHLIRATEVQKDFSAAFLSLGKCHEFLGQIEEAAAAYRTGIEAASRKGDLMPLREMERRMNALAGHEPSRS